MSSSAMPIQLGLCGVVQHKKDVKLQMIIRPQPFDLRQWHVSLLKLPTLLASTSAGRTRSALAAQTLMNFLATDKALSSCSKSVTIIGQAFERVTAFADALKSAADNFIQVNFVAIPDIGSSCSMTEKEFADFATGLADFENASASYCPCDPFAIHQLCTCFQQLEQGTGMMQVGKSTTLSMPSAQAAELQPAKKTGCGDEPSLHIVKRIRVHELSESLLFGWPNILIPHADSFDSIQDMEANEQCFTGLCQVLDEQQEVLLFNGCMDLDTMKATSWPLYYVARPACNGCSMLIRRIAADEELLPVSHLLARQPPEVPAHVRAGLQHTLQGVPVSEYSPLDHHTGALDRLAGLVSQSLPRSSTPPHTRTAHHQASKQRFQLPVRGQKSIDCKLMAKQNRV
ncbi:hypothetical protein WJX79_004735 [Trebouxia sp. C0005]